MLIILFNRLFCAYIIHLILFFHKDNANGSTSSHGGRTSTPNSALDAEKLEDTTVDNIKEEHGGSGGNGGGVGGLSPSMHHSGGSSFNSSISPLSSLMNQSAPSPVNSPLASLHSSANHHLALSSHHPNLNNNKGSGVSLLSPAAEGRNVDGNDSFVQVVSDTKIHL